MTAPRVPPREPPIQSTSSVRGRTPATGLSSPFRVSALKASPRAPSREVSSTVPPAKDSSKPAVLRSEPSKKAPRLPKV